MRSNYSLTTKKSWQETHGELEDTFRRWGVKDWEVRSLGKGDRSNYQGVEIRRVLLRFSTKDGRQLNLDMAKQGRAVDNLRVLFLAVEAMRMNEARGLGDVLQAAYLQLAGPYQARDPYEVLGVRSDAPIEVIDASYKALARSQHPDAGGSSDAMKELNDAYERVKAERATTIAGAGE